MVTVRLVEVVEKLDKEVSLSRVPCVDEEIVADLNEGPPGKFRVRRVRQFPVDWNGVDAAVVVTRIPDALDDFGR